MRNLFRIIKKNKLSVRETEKLVKNKKTKKVGKISKRQSKNNKIVQIENYLIKHFFYYFRESYISIFDLKSHKRNHKIILLRNLLFCKTL